MTTVLFVHGAGTGAYDADALLAGALGTALGSDHEVRIPRMPNESDPDISAWKKTIAAELKTITGRLVLVGHSLGGSTWLRYLCDEKLDRPVAAAYFLATPTYDGGKWTFDTLKLPADVAERLSAIPRLVFFHCRDDEVVPFAHLGLLAGRIPRAITRPIDVGGHQLDGVMPLVAADMRALP